MFLFREDALAKRSSRRFRKLQNSKGSSFSAIASDLEGQRYAADTRSAGKSAKYLKINGAGGGNRTALLN
jgi:hypothetical protein